MAFTTYDPHAFKYGILKNSTAAVIQDVWGTAETDARNALLLHCPAPNFPDDGIGVVERRLAGGSRTQIAAEYVPHAKQSLATFNIPAYEAKQDELQFWLYAWFQNVSEGAATPYAKTFTVNLSAQPDFTVDAGYFFTFVEFDPITAKSRKWKDCICSQLVLSCEPNGYLTVSPTIIARGAPTHASTPAGTWTAAASDFWHYADIDRATYSTGSPTTLNIEGSWELTLTSPVAGIGADGSGNYQSLIVPMPEMTLKVTSLHGTYTDAAYTARDAGTIIDYRIGWGNATAGTVDGDLDIVCSGKIQPDGIVKKQDGLVSLIETTVKILGDDSATAPITIIMANAVDEGW